MLGFDLEICLFRGIGADLGGAQVLLLALCSGGAPGSGRKPYVVVALGLVMLKASV